MRPLAFIMATPPGVNPGMILSDAMAAAFVSINYPAAPVDFFRIVSLSERLKGLDTELITDIRCKQDVGISHSTLESYDQLRDFIPVFWGDFLHEQLYISVLSAMYAQGSDRLHNILLLDAEFAPLRGKAVSFGTTFAHNRTMDLVHARYGTALESFIQQAAHLQFRDMLSAAIAQQMRPGTESCLGVDAVQLLYLAEYREHFLGRSAPPAKSDLILLYFSRFAHDIDSMGRLACEWQRSMACDAVWIEWGDEISFPFLRTGQSLRSSLGIPAVEADGPREMVQRVWESRLVITDTYHLAVASWAMGTPAILVVGTPHSEEIARDPLHHLTRPDKRVLAYLQLGLIDFVLTPACLRNASAAAMFNERARGLISCGLELNALQHRYAAFARASSFRLREALARSGP